MKIVTFNINSINTLFNYQPASQCKDLAGFFAYLGADIVALQELKVSKENVNNFIGKVENFYSFVTVPRERKGYSGVGVYIRRPQESDPEAVKSFLRVVKVEEGLSGYLRCYDYTKSIKCYKDLYDISRRTASSSTSNTQEYREFAKKHLIGGYSKLFTRERCLQLDNEGRSVLVELGSGVVLICVYCPANSMMSRETEQFRVDFLRLLLDRAQTIAESGKEVVLMGDVNVVREVIDSEEELRKYPSSAGASRNVTDSENAAFASATIPRVCFNSKIFGSPLQSREKVYIDIENNILDTDTSGNPILVSTSNNMQSGKLFVDEEFEEDAMDDLIPVAHTLECKPFLYDLFRESQGPLLKQYTCWNTLKNNRPRNYGSRIDLILATKKIKEALVLCQHLPDLMGSDHCPVFCDLDVNKMYSDEDASATAEQTYVPKFEAKHIFSLNDGSILTMFKNFNQNSILGKRKVVEEIIEDVEDVEVVSEKKPEKLEKPQTGSAVRYVKNGKNFKQRKISGFFEASKKEEKPKDLDILYQEVKKKVEYQEQKEKKKPMLNMFGLNYAPPKCKHNDACVLRTSTKKESKGKKFWCCSRDVQCRYFEWKK